MNLENGLVGEVNIDSFGLFLFDVCDLASLEESLIV